MHIVKWAAGAAVALLATAAFGQRVPSYTFELLPGAPGRPAQTITAFNDRGQAAGNIYTDDQGSLRTHAALWDFNTGTVTDLGTLGGPFSTARGINNAGQVVGDSDPAPTAPGGSRATLWNGTIPVDLNLGTEGTAYAINDAGVIVGETFYSSGCGFVWTAGTATCLATVDGLRAVSARGINNAGQIAGAAVDANVQGHLVRWTGGAIEDLTPDTGGGHQTFSFYSQGMNAGGQIAGNMWGRLAPVALLAADGPATFLPKRAGGGSYAAAINDAGVVVGSIAGQYGVAWINGRLFGLTALVAPGQLPSGWFISSPSAISNDGWIACTVYTNPGYAACLLKPIK